MGACAGWFSHYRKESERLNALSREDQMVEIRKITASLKSAERRLAVDSCVNLSLSGLVADSTPYMTRAHAYLLANEIERLRAQLKRGMS